MYQTSIPVLLVLACHGAAAFGPYAPGVVARAVAEAATTTAPGLMACVTADGVLEACYSQGYLDTAVPLQTQEACACCLDGQPILDQYASCTSYIEASAASETAVYTLASAGYAMCAAANVCGGGGGGGGGGGSGGGGSTGSGMSGGGGGGGGGGFASVTSAGSSGGGASGSALAPACTSIVDLIDICASANPGFSTMDAADQASCLCYDTSNNYVTSLDAWASTCASNVKTADPADYSSIAALETFCAVYGGGDGTGGAGSTIGGFSGTTTGGGATITKSHTSATTTATGGFGGGGGGFGGGGGSQSSSASSTTVTKNVAPVVAYGPVVWAANALTFVLSLFFLL